MSTRACYTFSDQSGDVHVYKHHDGYPYCKFPQGEGGGLVWINDAKKFAWPLPRFEADEFAAAFVAANKVTPTGGVRLINTPDPWDFSSDSEYWYKVSCVDGELFVAVFSVDWWKPEDPSSKLVMEGTLDSLLGQQRAKKEVA
tara:strand:+ start:670 stop:1098 length:429 start_codon:yes stop_codon:yes gene_type:complete